MRLILFLVLKTVVLRVPDNVTVKAIISGRRTNYYKSVSPCLQSQSSPRFSDNSRVAQLK